MTEIGEKVCYNTSFIEVDSFSHPNTFTLSHSHTLTPSHLHTLTLSHSHTLTGDQPEWRSEAESESGPCSVPGG